MAKTSSTTNSITFRDSRTKQSSDIVRAMPHPSTQPNDAAFSPTSNCTQLGTDHAAQRTRLIARGVLSRGLRKASGTSVAQRPEQIGPTPIRPSNVRSRPGLQPPPRRKSPLLPHSRWRAIDAALPKPLVFEPRHDAPCKDARRKDAPGKDAPGKDAPGKSAFATPYQVTNT